MKIGRDKSSQDMNNENQVQPAELCIGNSLASNHTVYVQRYF